MKNIESRPFHILADCGNIYQFLIEIYEKNWKNGVPAPFLNTHMHPLHPGWIFPIHTKTVFGNVMVRLWHFAFMRIL